MSSLLPPSVAIAVATSSPSHENEKRGLLGVALFLVEEHTPGDFVYQVQIRTIPAAVSEAALVKWMIPHLPKGRVTIGWQLADWIVPALIAAGNAATPTAALELVDALAATVSIDAVDLADRHGGVAAPSFKALCAAVGIPAVSLDGNDHSSRDPIRDIDVTTALATNVISSWRLWALAQRPGDPVPQQFAADVLDQWRVDDEATRAWRHLSPD